MGGWEDRRMGGWMGRWQKFDDCKQPLPEWCTLTSKLAPATPAARSTGVLVNKPLVTNTQQTHRRFEGGSWRTVSPRTRTYTHTAGLDKSLLADLQSNLQTLKVVVLKISTVSLSSGLSPPTGSTNNHMLSGSAQQCGDIPR